jgi:ribonuclease HI
LYDIYEKEAPGGAIYETPDQKITIKLTQLGFVDDVNNRTNLPWTNNNPESTSQLLQRASQDSQLWYNIMEAANQSLELTKCKYHVMEFHFKASGKPVMVTHKNPEEQLIVQDKNQNRVTITHTPNNEAIKYLGCWKAPQGQTQQKESLTKKCGDYARIINCSTLTRRETSYFYEGIYKSSVGYPLPLTYFNEKELEKIQAKAHQAMITHCGYNRNTSRAVIYGSTDLGGAAFSHLYELQGYGQIEMFLKSWRARQTHQGILLRIAVQWTQYCAGTSTSILIDTSTKLPHVEATWMLSLRKYLDDIKGTIQVDQPGIPPAMREKDQHIMDIILQSKKYKPHQIRKINYCRLYMNVTTLSEITNAKGDMIDPAMIEGKRENTISQEKWRRIHQQKPDAASWNLWKRMCKDISTRINNKWYLNRRLGRWLVPHEEMRRQWRFWYDIDSETLYQKTNERISKHLKMWHDFDENGESADNIPSKAIPVEVTRGTNTWRLKPYCNERMTSNATQDNQSMEQQIEAMPEWEKELLQGVNLQVTEDRIQSKIKQPFKVASDGSVQTERASFAWTIATNQGERLATCAGPAYGCKTTSYRAEGYGILSVFRFLKMARTQWGDIGPCHLVCDNEALVKELNHQYDITKVQPNQTTIAEWDIISEIYEAKKEINETRIQHIKGHADDHQQYERLTLLQQLNVDADRLANEYIQDNQAKEYRWAKLLPTSGAQLNLQTGTITYQMKKHVKKAKTSPQLKDYICKKNGWEPEIMDMVAWEPHRRAINKQSKQKVTMVKFLHGMTPVGKRVSKYDKKYTAQCPSCEEPMETQEHLYQCPNPNRQQWRDQFKDAMKHVMEKYETPETMKRLWLEGINKGMMEDPTPIGDSPDMEDIIEAQEKIGWNQMLKGRIAHQWLNHQRDSMGNGTTKRKNATTWATDMISTIFEYWLKLWKMRNEDKHGKDAATRREAEKQQAIRELEQMYEDNENTHETWIIQRPIEELKRKSTYMIRAAISNYRPVLEEPSLEESHQTQLETG